jgi:hypothetical protein
MLHRLMMPVGGSRAMMATRAVPIAQMDVPCSDEDVGQVQHQGSQSDAAVE